MSKKRVVLARSNLINRDPWLAKEIDTLKRWGYVPTLICWDRECNIDDSRQKLCREIRLRFRAPWGTKVLPFLPVWWCFQFFAHLLTKGDIIHAINLDSAIVALIASKLRRQPMIYEMFDVYVDLIRLPRLVRWVGIRIEKLFMRLANAVIIANEAQEKELGGIPNNNVYVIYNTPPDLFERPPVRKHATFTLFYAGVLYRSRPSNLDKVFQAIRDIEGVQLIIAGYGDLATEIKQWVNQNEGKVKFIGKISYDEVLKETMASDLLFALYDTSVPGVRYATCNKLFEAMMCHKPIIVSEGTAMAEIVRRENCGLVVDPSSVQEIKKAIMRLKEDPELYYQLGANGRVAFEKKYSRKIMEQRLLTVYEKIGQGQDIN